MICPNCSKEMDGISMSGDDTEITHEAYCNYCHTYVIYKYNPQVTHKILYPKQIENNLNYETETDLDLPF